MTDEYARTNDEMVHKAAAVRSMKEIRAAGTTRRVGRRDGLRAGDARDDREEATKRMTDENKTFR